MWLLILFRRAHRAGAGAGAWDEARADDPEGVLRNGALLVWRPSLAGTYNRSHKRSLITAQNQLYHVNIIRGRKREKLLLKMCIDFE